MYSGITIDNVEYKVRIKYGSIRRIATVIQGNNRGTSLYPSTISDVMGTAYEYTMEIERDETTPNDYNNFYQVITAPVAYHSVTLPYNNTTLTFNAEILTAEDTALGSIGGYNKWSNLQITFVPIEPQRMPT